MRSINEISNTPTHVNNILVLKNQPRVLRKRNCANDNLIHSITVKPASHKTEHIPVDACNDIPRPSTIDQNGGMRDLLIELPEPVSRLPLPSED
jgi:hypothetical protein